MDFVSSTLKACSGAGLLFFDHGSPSASFLPGFVVDRQQMRSMSRGQVRANIQCRLLLADFL
jgi:hypothetical protein